MTSDAARLLLYVLLIAASGAGFVLWPEKGQGMQWPAFVSGWFARKPKEAADYMALIQQHEQAIADLKQQARDEAAARKSAAQVESAAADALEGVGTT